MMTLVFAFTTQAKKNYPYLGPTVEECKIDKKGNEKCKIKNLKGQKAIIYIYQALLEANAAIAENADQIAALEIDTTDLQEQINDLGVKISANESEIAANAAYIADLFNEINALQVAMSIDVQNLNSLRADLVQFQIDSAAQATVVQGQIAQLQDQITQNNDTLIGLLAALRQEVESVGHKARFGTVCWPSLQIYQSHQGGL
jgi:predicted  nucleic acid-binding Zn-ribbon protein